MYTKQHDKPRGGHFEMYLDDAKELLQSYKEAMKRVRYLQGRLDYGTIRSSSDWSNIPSGTGATTRSVEEAIMRREEIEQEIKDIRQEYERIEVSISKMNGTSKSIIEMLYRDGLKIPVVKQRLGLFDNSLWRKYHDRAKYDLFFEYYTTVWY